ncbi:hypothetical protein G7084_01215 [Weissella coleopterorum]|uniref:Uncharacterized protein n=1 Tax=Weissella coleopterorum TaxID=2714949 RepID=A0A6G8AYI2_9LACO|nr:hypothetical protein [Weissella coleopterorum]QIL50057.1 hypothetical protein G7084_01215 [Weissella coleopterorum]
MNHQQYQHFKTIVAELNQYKIEPIVVGTASVELLANLDFDAKMIPLVLADKMMNNTQNITEIMQRLAFKPGVDENQMLFSDDVISLDLLSYSEFEAYTGFQLNDMLDLHKHQNPNYQVMPATYTIGTLDALLRMPKRSDVLKSQDKTMMNYLEAHGYILDRLNLNPVDQLVPWEYRIVQPTDDAQIEDMLRDQRPDDLKILLKRIKNARKSRIRKYNNLEIVATVEGTICGHATVELGVLMSDDESDGWIVGNLLDLTFSGVERAHGLLEQFLIRLEEALITSTPAVLMVAESNFGQLEKLGFEPLKFTDLRLPVGLKSDRFMVKELFQGVLDNVSGQLTFAKDASDPSSH